jgi:hypothetical protein
MEQLDLTAPTVASVLNYKVTKLHIETTPAYIEIETMDNLGNKVTNSYTSTPSPTGATAASLLSTLNRGNFSVNSLQKQIINKLVADGYLPAGTVSGVPQ